jgi:predicted transcriptional regulator
MGDLSDFERGWIVGARSAGASVTNSAILLDVSRATVSEVMSAYTNNRKTASVKSNIGRKSTLVETDCRTLSRICSKNHRTTAAQMNCNRTEYSSEDCFHKNCPTWVSQIQHPR